MSEKPEQVLPQKRTAPAADVRHRAVNDQTSRQKEARVRHAIHELHDNGSLKRRKGEEQQKRGHELRPDEEWQTHPGQTLGSQLDDCGDEINRTEERGRDQKNKPDQPKRLSVKQWMEGRAVICDVGQGCGRCPPALGRAARYKKARQHNHAANSKRPETGRVYFRKCHVGRADLKRHDKIAKGGEGHRHDSKKNHNRAMHRAKGIIQIGRNRTVGSHVLSENIIEKAADDGQWLARIGDRPAHDAHQAETKKEEEQGHEAVLNADHLVIGGENVFSPESELVMFVPGVVGVRIVMRFETSGSVHFRRKVTVSISGGNPALKSPKLVEEADSLKG